MEKQKTSTKNEVNLKRKLDLAQKKVISLQRSQRALIQSFELERTKSKIAYRYLFKQNEFDRKQLSHELHDEIAQMLTAINLELAVLGKEAAKGSELIQNKIKNTQNLVEKSVDLVHRFARELRPIALDGLGLLAALRAHAKAFTKQTQIPVIVRSNRFKEPTEVTRIVLFRVLQEALNNITKHAHATKVSVSVSAKNSIVSLSIQDNGVSFNVKKQEQQRSPERLGLIGMRERVNMLGGSMRISSSPEHGTLIQAKIHMEGLIQKK